MKRLLGGCACLTDPGLRPEVLDMVAEVHGAPLPVRDHPVPTYFVALLTRLCARDRGVLQAVVEVLLFFEDANAEEVRRFEEEAFAEPLFRPDDVARLGRSLKALEVPNLAGLCRRAAGPFQDVPVFPDPWAAFEGMQGLNARADGLPPALALVEHLALEAPYPCNEELRDWSDDQAALSGLRPALRDLRESVARVPPAAPTDACLVVRIEPAPSPGAYRLTSWRNHDETGSNSWNPWRGETVTVSGDTLERVVQTLVDEAEEGWANRARSLLLEFEVAGAEMALPIHLWRREIDSDIASPLVLKHSVVLRSLDRSRDRRCHSRWMQRWRRMDRAGEGARCVVVGGGGRGDPPYDNGRSLESHLERDEFVVALALSGPPKPGTEGDREARRALLTGLPILLWDHRADGPRRNGPTAEALAILAARRPVELREHVRGLRLQAHAHVADEEQHLGHRIVLLWDDPTRPVCGEAPLRGPGQGVGGP